jgi:hypothetical protein
LKIAAYAIFFTSPGSAFAQSRAGLPTPTGMDLFNVLGKTLHIFAELDRKNMKKDMKKKTQE